MPAGKVTSVAPGNSFKHIAVDPTGTRNSPEEVLIVLRGVHQPIPEQQMPSREVYLGPDVEAPKGAAAGTGIEPPAKPAATDADRLRKKYKDIGEAQNHKFGEGLPGSLPPDFNLKAKPAGAAGSAEAPKPAAARPAAPPESAPPATAAPPF